MHVVLWMDVIDLDGSRLQRLLNMSTQTHCSSLLLTCPFFGAVPFIKWNSSWSSLTFYHIEIDFICAFFPHSGHFYVRIIESMCASLFWVHSLTTWSLECLICCFVPSTCKCFWMVTWHGTTTCISLIAYPSCCHLMCQACLLLSLSNALLEALRTMKEYLCCRIVPSIW